MSRFVLDRLLLGVADFGYSVGLFNCWKDRRSKLRAKESKSGISCGREGSRLAANDLQLSKSDKGGLAPNLSGNGRFIPEIDRLDDRDVEGLSARVSLPRGGCPGRTTGMVEAILGHERLRVLMVVISSLSEPVNRGDHDARRATSGYMSLFMIEGKTLVMLSGKYSMQVICRTECLPLNGTTRV